MKRIYAFLMTLVLLTVGAINVCAQTINGKSESAYWKKSMTYTFLGGRVKDGVVDGINTKDEYLYEVIEGATLRFEFIQNPSKTKVQRTSNGIVTTIATNIDLSTSVDANMFKMPTGYRQSSQ